MSRLKIDLIAPPFHGHLHPILGLAQILREFADIRILTTPDVADQIIGAGFDHVPILAEHVQRVWGIANTTTPVRGRPWMLLRQFRENLSLLNALRGSIDTVWSSRRPDLAVVDFTLPSVGHWAKAQGIRWWTSHPSPLAIETPDGTPSYLGSWRPPRTWMGRARNSLGRKVIRLFKRGVFAHYSRDLCELGVCGAYRPDGSEAVYSDELILALGSDALEFPATWPKALRFVGPIFYSAQNPDPLPLRLDSTRKNVLVTIGTHLPYARLRFLRQLQKWAERCLDVFFHYTTGGSHQGINSAGKNWRVYQYLNYADTIDRFDAVVHHGGAGITYHCLRAAVPVVVWPQDYDQFDFAARLEERGLAIRCRSAAAVPFALKRALADASLQSAARQFSVHLRAQHQREILKNLLQERGLLNGNQ